MEVVDNASDENNENTRRKATVVPIKIEYVWEDKPFNNVDVQKWASIFIPKMKGALDFMKKMLKRLCTGFLALATVVTALPTTPVHAESKQYWTESAERVGIIEKVMNDGSIGSTFNEGYMKVEDETAYCIDINTDFKNGYKTRADASSRMSADQISDVSLSLEYVKQYGETHKELNYNWQI